MISKKSWCVISTTAVAVGLFLICLCLLVLPNKIDTVTCTIDQNLIETTYKARKTSCRCTIVTAIPTSCDSLLISNQTGRCIDFACCFQAGNQECEILGATICDLDYCWKTSSTVTMSYKGRNRTFASFCEGDSSYCDLGTSIDECVAKINFSYSVGAKKCYYREGDDRFELFKFEDNDEFIGGFFLMGFISIAWLVVTRGIQEHK